MNNEVIDGDAGGTPNTVYFAKAATWLPASFDTGCLQTSAQAMLARSAVRAAFKAGKMPALSGFEHVSQLLAMIVFKLVP